VLLSLKSLPRQANSRRRLGRVQLSRRRRCAEESSRLHTGACGLRRCSGRCKLCPSRLLESGQHTLSPCQHHRSSRGGSLQPAQPLSPLLVPTTPPYPRHSLTRSLPLHGSEPLFDIWNKSWKGLKCGGG